MVNYITNIFSMQVILIIKDNSIIYAIKYYIFVCRQLRHIIIIIRNNNKMSISRAKLIDNLEHGETMNIKLVDVGTGEVIKPTKNDIIHIIEDFIVDSSQDDRERIEVLVEYKKYIIYILCMRTPHVISGAFLFL